METHKRKSDTADDDQTSPDVSNEAKCHDEHANHGKTDVPVELLLNDLIDLPIPVGSGPRKSKFVSW